MYSSFKISYMIIITYICIIVYCMVENVNVIKDRLKSLAPCRGDILRFIVRRMFINILILQQNKRQLNSLSLVIIILFSEFPQLLKLSLFLTLTFSPDLAVYLDKKENRVVRRLLCCGSPNWARTSDIMINSHALYRLSYGGLYNFL